LYKNNQLFHPKPEKMIQRIQTVYLFLVFVFSVLFITLPLANFTQAGIETSLRLSNLQVFYNAFEQVSRGWTGILLVILIAAAMVITIVTTFYYKRRLTQLFLGNLNLFIHVALIVISFLYVDNIRKQIPEPEFSYGPGIFFPIISLLLIFMANRAIRKDEELVRSADRIR